MKKKWWIVVLMLFVVGATILILSKDTNEASGQTNDSSKKSSIVSEYQFDAIVLEIHDDYIMVEALEGQQIVGEVRVQLGLLTEKQIPNMKKGDTVRITHDGKMTMSLPPQMTAVEEIEIIK
jgi:hypothetical protein